MFDSRRNDARCRRILGHPTHVPLPSTAVSPRPPSPFKGSGTRRLRRVWADHAGTVGVVDASLPRLRRLAVSQELYRWLTLASAAMLIVIVASGASVRLTGSGLGCLDWPGCSAGHPLPKVAYHAYIEFSNRIVSALTIFATLGAWIATLLYPRAPRWVRWVAGLAFVGTFAAGAARCDHGALQAQPAARRHALPAHARRSRPRGDRRAGGVAGPRRACPSADSGSSRLLVGLSLRGADRDRHALDGGRPSLGLGGCAAHLEVPLRGLAPRARDRGVRARLPRADRAARPASEPPLPCGRSSCSVFFCVQMVVGEIQYRTASSARAR